MSIERLCYAAPWCKIVWMETPNGSPEDAKILIESVKYGLKNKDNKIITKKYE